jgi:ribonuclease P/MRP protein subunit POP7
LRSNGRLTNRAVERAIAETAERDGKGTTKEVEWVYVKATGRAIPRALEIGCYFQGQADCRVRVEIGSVCAIDDIEIKPDAEKAVQKEEQERGEGMDTGDVAMTDADDDNGEQRKGEGGRKKRKKQVVAEEDVPETRLRNLSAVTVSICLK